jgi:hypothetical protein
MSTICSDGPEFSYVSMEEPGMPTSEKDARLASKQLGDPKAPKAEKSVAGSALSQTKRKVPKRG